VSARDRLFFVACDDMPVTSNEVNEAIDAYAHELTEKIRAAMEEARAADWGRASRSKRAYLQGMERAKKVITPEVSNSE
jgi:hypothetical protein